MIIEDIKKHLESSCPEFMEKKLNINCLGEKSGSLALKTVPCEEIVKKYADGGVLKQYVFEICMRTTLDNDISDNIETALFMENVQSWLYCFSEAESMEFSRKGAFPLEYEVLKTHGVSHRDRSGAEHSIRARLIYEEK